jgi:hypothetical protein
MPRSFVARFARRTADVENSTALSMPKTNRFTRRSRIARLHPRLDERERVHRRGSLRRSREGDAAAEGMPHQVRAVLQQLGDPSAVGLRIVGAARVGAPPMAGPIGNDELPALLSQRSLGGEVALAAHLAALGAAVHQDHPRARMAPAGDVDGCGLHAVLLCPNWNASQNDHLVNVMAQELL